MQRERESERSSREPWREKQGCLRTKTESPRQSEVQGTCLGYLKTKMMSRWRFDRRTHLAVTSEKTQHEEDRMRDIHVGKKRIRGSRWRTTWQVEEYSTIWGRSSECSSVFRPNCCSGISCEWWGHVAEDVQISVQISAWDPFYEMDGRKSRYTGEVLRI